MTSSVPLSAQAPTHDEHDRQTLPRPNETDAMGVEATTGLPHSKRNKLTTPDVVNEAPQQGATNPESGTTLPAHDEQPYFSEGRLNTAAATRLNRTTGPLPGTFGADGTGASTGTGTETGTGTGTTHENQSTSAPSEKLPFKEKVKAYAKVHRGTILGDVAQKETGQKILAQEIPPQ